MFRNFWMLGCVVLLVAVRVPVFGADPKVHEGMVVSAGDGKLVMTDTAGKSHTHTVPEAAKITVNGKPGKLADLKPGVRIRVMSDGDGKVMSVATVDDVKFIRRFIAQRTSPADFRQTTMVP